MPLLLSGKKFRNDLEAASCLAIHSPLEGGSETRLLRRLRAAGYRTQILSVRGFLMAISSSCRLSKSG